MKFESKIVPMLRRLVCLSFALIVPLVGCSGGQSFEVAGGDATTDDATEDSTTDAPGSDTSVAMDTGGHVVSDPCAGKPDGAACSSLAGFLCVKESCVPTSCGDGYADKANGEDCDDKNDILGDGCDNCRYTCAKDDTCDDGEVCNGKEVCDLTKHVCKSGTDSTDGVTCTILGGTPGACNGGTCAALGCGNKIVTAGEDCDDGNDVDGDGCDNDCLFSCKSNADCDDGDVCNGVETCDPTAHTCSTTIGKLDCDDGLACTVDSCDAKAGCLHDKIDGDGDGHGCSDDCNDGDPSIYVGAPELCDGKDNDCNGIADDGMVVMATCFPDGDGDGYGAKDGAITACTCPAGTTPTPNDCVDGNKYVHPKEETFFGFPYCAVPSSTGGGCSKTSYDYNCDGVEEKQGTTVFSGTCAGLAGTACSNKMGWKSSVPGCGESGTFVRCYSSSGLCKYSEFSYKQPCR
jgi:cysteine-rich repeat protein